MVLGKYKTLYQMFLFSVKYDVDPHWTYLTESIPMCTNRISIFLITFFIIYFLKTHLNSFHSFNEISI